MCPTCTFKLQGFISVIGNASPEVFYRLTVLENVFAAIDTCGSVLDTSLRIVTIAGGETLAVNRTLGINDDHDGEGPDTCSDTDSFFAAALSPGIY